MPSLDPDDDSSFNEPKTDDQTTTPPAAGTLKVASANPVMQALSKIKGAKIKPPSTLAAQIAKSKRARQGSHKYGV
jgi:hypothetical protein